MDEQLVEIADGKTWVDAMHGYVKTLRSIVKQFPDAEILELGGGRWPSFRLTELPATVRSYTVNDVSERELALAPEEYQTACFDVTGDASAFAGRYDVVFSRFLAEHLRDGRAMHRNVYEVLKSGGVAFHLIPTLFALPFVINKLLPERLGRRVIQLFAPHRYVDPIFPAFYSCCRGDVPSMHRIFNELGYRRVLIHNFYGHLYYESIPVLRSIEKLFAKIAARNNWSWCATYAYIIAYK